MSENVQGMLHLMHENLSEAVEERRILMHSLPVSEMTSWSKKFKELENVQAQEKDKLEIVNKNMDA